MDHNVVPLFNAGEDQTPTSRRGIGGHQSAHMKSDTWLTPPHIIAALGPFDLDPCAAPEPRPWPTATTHYVKADDGLSKPWFGRVWVNPPYGRETAKWMARLAEHGRGTALIFARTETSLFFNHVWSSASALLFLEGRLHFHRADGTRAAANGGAPSVLIAYGDEDADRLASSGLPGALTTTWRAA